MNFYEQSIIPYQKVGEVKLGYNQKVVENIFKQNNLKYSIRKCSNHELSIKVPWIILTVDNVMECIFAEDKLWRIDVLEKYRGVLSNGIGIGVTVEEAMKIDKGIRFDDFEEIYMSSEGYWFEDVLPEKIINSICIFDKEQAQRFYGNIVSE